MSALTDLFSPTTRKWIYNVAVAVVPLLVVLGVITNDIAGQVLIIAGAVLGLGTNLLASANTNTSAEYKG